MTVRRLRREQKNSKTVSGMNNLQDVGNLNPHEPLKPVNIQEEQNKHAKERQLDNNNIIYMADDRDRAIRDYVMLTPQVVHPEIIRPEVEAVNFELKAMMFQMLQTVGQFNRLPNEDPHLHLKLFLEVNDAFKIAGATQDALRLRLFPYSLRDRVRAWLNSLPSNSITTWNELVDKFLMKYFPPTKNVKLWNEITYFHQLEDESLYEVWERFKELLRRCPHHDIPCCIQLETFYNVLNPSTRLMVDASANGALLSKSYTEAYEILERIANNNYQWPSTRQPTARGSAGVHNIDAITALLAQVTSLTNIVKTMTSAPVVVKQVAELFCVYCGEEHDFDNCPGNPASLGVGECRPTTVTLQLADRSHAYPEEKIEDVLVKVDKFIFPVDFIVLDFEADKEKGRITIITNERDELIPTRTVTGWRVYMDYRKLNKATRKDHFPLPFIDQMLDRLAGKQYYCFLDEYLGYNQITIAPEDQEKTTFTCPMEHLPSEECPLDFANYLVSGLLPPKLKFQKKKKFLHDVRSYQWDDPHLYKLCLDKVIRRCASEGEIPHILESCHAAAYGGHFGGHRTAAKVLQSGYYWSIIFKNAYEFVKCCDRCQRTGNITKRHEMPLTTILEVEVFDVWGIDFMGHFPSSFENLYILIAVNYVSKFGTARAIINDEGTHFCNKIFAAAMAKYGVRHKSVEASHMSEGPGVEYVTVARVMPTTHTTTVSQEMLVLLFVIVRGLPIDVGSIITNEIRDCAVKNHKTATLLFPSVITSICVVSGIRLGARDDYVKNDGAFTARTIERVAEEKDWFWSYLQHLDNQLHQFALYMKHTQRNFPDSLLQQYNFDTNTTSAPAEASEEATATDEPEEEAAAEPQAEVESENAEPFDQPEEEGD
ncbi:hypothetical protein KPL71_021867 [Citrus sinensis]|uniref:Uncharacterized protein n=1 Tax=Citrus sinensis TaxID=2711 RepID=A0ACB8JIJ0_CITSI|nr:hypothetical protein KPL71_021867 [Citrus sinensis]